MEHNNNCVVRTKNLSKSFGKVQALKSINLNVPEHSIFGLLGPNGAGKTTIINILLGLSRPTSGSGNIFGFDIVNESVKIRERIGYLPQRPMFIEYMSARENLMFMTRFFDLGSKKEIIEHCDDILKLVGLADNADRLIEQFSSVEKQRLGIALAQINYPDLLILDEPVSLLDPMERQEVFEVINRIRKDTTVIFATHKLDEVQCICDAVAIINHGKLEACGPSEDLLNGKQSIECLIATKDLQEQTGKRLSSSDLVKHYYVKQRDSIDTVTGQVIVNDTFGV